tara:strand:+ start:397 stop:501 length:105 start_codon:yes stop_codon:yes gene_type:complete
MHQNSNLIEFLAGLLLPLAVNLSTPKNMMAGAAS